MKIPAIVVSLVVAAQFAAPQAAYAAKCANRGLVVQQLADRFDETLQGSQRQKGAVLELFASRQTQSWTLMLATNNGLSCLVSSGKGFDDVDPRFRGLFVTLDG